MSVACNITHKYATFVLLCVRCSSLFIQVTLCNNVFFFLSDQSKFNENEINNNNNEQVYANNAQSYEVSYINTQQSSTVIPYSPIYPHSSPEEAAVADTPHNDWESFDPLVISSLYIYF